MGKQKTAAQKAVAAERRERKRKSLAALSPKLSALQRDKLKAMVKLGHDDNARVLQTAAAHRPIARTSVPGHGERFYIDHFAEVFPKRGDRTPARQAAWLSCQDAFARANLDGLPAPKFEVGVDCSPSGDGGVAKLDAARKVMALQNRVGVPGWHMLNRVIHKGETFGEIENETGLERRRGSAVFTVALDEAARFFGHDKGPGVLEIAQVPVLRGW